MALFPPDTHAHSVFHYMVSAVERNSSIPAHANNRLYLSY
jgi:hypothetical protein